MRELIKKFFRFFSKGTHFKNLEGTIDESMLPCNYKQRVLNPKALYPMPEFDNEIYKKYEQIFVYYKRPPESFEEWKERYSQIDGVKYDYLLSLIDCVKIRIESEKSFRRRKVFIDGLCIPMLEYLFLVTDPKNKIQKEYKQEFAKKVKGIFNAGLEKLPKDKKERLGAIVRKICY